MLLLMTGFFSFMQGPSLATFVSDGNLDRSCSLSLQPVVSLWNVQQTATSSAKQAFKSDAAADTLTVSSCRGTAWQPLAVTEAYMGLDPQVFNSEVRRRALEWKSNQEADFRAKASATLKERVQAETHAYLTRMGILDTTNPVLKNLQVRAASLLIRPRLQTG